MIVAKPVVDKQFWILQDGNEKVGNVEACAGGYQVKLNNTIQQYKSIKMVTQRHDIVFAPVEKTVKSTAVSDVHGYPTVGKIHNPMWDVKHKLPVYTKTNNSKSWFAAGWYEVKRGRSWKVVQDPKLITLQRYKYQGPFHSKEEANDKSVS
jgi:hypothetical protein